MIDEQAKESFVARIWLERGENGESIWRGHIRHVQGEEEQYFGDLVAMSEFLGRVSGVTGLPMTEGGATATRFLRKHKAGKRRD